MAISPWHVIDSLDVGQAARLLTDINPNSLEEDTYRSLSQLRDVSTWSGLLFKAIRAGEFGSDLKQEWDSLASRPGRPKGFDLELFSQAADFRIRKSELVAWLKRMGIHEHDMPTELKTGAPPNLMDAGTSLPNAEAMQSLSPRKEESLYRVIGALAEALADRIGQGAHNGEAPNALRLARYLTGTDEDGTDHGESKAPRPLKGIRGMSTQSLRKVIGQGLNKIDDAHRSR